MKVISYQSLLYITVFCVGSQVHGFDVINRKYQEWMLGSAVQKAILPYRQNQNKCSLLLKPKISRFLAEKHYQAPWWVRIGGRVPVKESMFSYASDIYGVIVNIIDLVFDSLEKINTIKLTQVSKDSLLDLRIKKGDLEAQLNLVINSPTEDIEITAQNIEDNINKAGKILEDLKQILPGISSAVQIQSVSPQISVKSKFGQKDQKASQWSAVQKEDFYQKLNEFQQEQGKIGDVKQIVMNKATKGIELLEALKNKPRMSLIERWHRDKQLKRFSAYVDRYCRTTSSN